MTTQRSSRSLHEPHGDGAPTTAMPLPGSAEIRRLFARPACRIYVDTAAYGLPPLATLAALHDALDAWRDGTARWPSDWDAAGDECRRLMAELLEVPAAELALLPAVSVGVGLIAASLGPDDEVVVPDDEFRSVLFPLLAAASARGARVRRVPFTSVAEAVGPQTTLVASSHVRSNGGGVQDLEGIAAAARAHGARVLVDATHSAGILRIPVQELELDVVLMAAYKHLLSPRGVAFMRIAPTRWPAVAPFTSSWRSTSTPYANYFGGDLEALAPTAARFDVSLAWHPWVGARESLRLLAALDAHARESWAVGLADKLADELGLPRTHSSILGIPVADVDAARETLRAESIAASFVAGEIRVSFHIYNTPEDVDALAAVLRRLLRR